MSFIEKISFENFRVFDDEFEMELKPISFLTGPNSSGKSSVLKSILLLKNNYSSSLQVLDFTGEKHNLGTFKNTLNKNCKVDQENHHESLISLGLTTKLKNGSMFGMGLYKEPITTRRSIFYILREEAHKNETTLKLNLTYRRFDRSGKLARIELFSNEEINPFICLNIAKDDTGEHTLEVNANTLFKDDYLNELFLNFRITKDRKKLKNTRSTLNLSRKYVMSSKFNIQEGNKEIFYDEPILIFTHLYKQFLEDNFKSQINVKDVYSSYFFKQPLKQILHNFSAILENTEYIEAVRANTKRLYTNDSQGTSFNELILDYNSRDIEAISKKFINKWLKQFEIADEIVFENIEGVANTIYLLDNSEKIALADLGYGITQFLPILLKVALEHPIKKSKNDESTIVKKLILLEEPETNLHPKLQSLLADFIVDVIKTFEVRFIIETHSEYLIRRMQILISDGKSIKNNDSIIYYFNSKKTLDNEKVIKINFLENGTLDKDFGDGFYDEATNLKFELLKRKAQQ